jgi:hypothetical protein
VFASQSEKMRIPPIKYDNLLDGREVPDGAGVFHQEGEQEGHNYGNPQAGRDAQKAP